jgi:MYXO-CTERM domain-containing protein
VAPSNPQVIYVTSIYGPSPFDVSVHRSPDGGGSFVKNSLGTMVDGQPAADLHLLAVDPRDPNVIYLRAQVTFVGDGALVARQALIRSTDGGMTGTTIWEMNGTTTSSGTSRGIDGVAIDVPRGKVYVATADGLLEGSDPGSAPTVTLTATSMLSQAQCVDVFQGNVFACANNYAPDSAALAKSTDGAQSFTSVLRFADTKGPVSCPAGTPVADQCPYYWLTYGEALGVINPGIDGGADMGTNPPGGGCACDIGSTGKVSLAPLVLLLVALVLRRRRRMG